jgi:preprotein translocase subunit SecG
MYNAPSGYSRSIAAVWSTLPFSLRTGVTSVTAAIYIALILVSVGIIVLVTLQAKGSGLGGIFGSADTVYKSRRGAEKTVFQLTIVFAAIFLILDLIAVIVHGS